MGNDGTENKDIAKVEMVHLFEGAEKAAKEDAEVGKDPGFIS